MRTKLIIAITLLAVLLAGCGGPKADVPIFLMTNSGMPQEVAQKLEKSLQQLVGETPTVSINTSPIFNMEKLMVEVAAGGNGIIIIPKEQFEIFAKQGGLVNLDEILDPKDYPDGVIEPAADPKKPDEKPEKHLYGIPVSGTKWLKDAGYKGEELYAFVHPRAPKLEEAKQVLKTIAGK